MDNISEMYLKKPGIAILVGISLLKKWLKDRKGRIPNFVEIEHYEQIIAILINTYEIIKCIG